MNDPTALDRPPTASDLFRLLQPRPPRSTTFINLTIDGVLELRLNDDVLGAVEVDFGDGCWDAWIVGRVTTGPMPHALPSVSELTVEAVHADIKRVLVHAAHMMPEDADARRFVEMAEHPPTQLATPPRLPVPTAIIAALSATGLGDYALGLSGWKPRGGIDNLTTGRQRKPAELARLLRARHGGSFVLAVAAVIDEFSSSQDGANGTLATFLAREAIKAQHAAGEMNVDLDAAPAVAAFALKALSQLNLAALGDLGETWTSARAGGGA